MKGGGILFYFFRKVKGVIKMKTALKPTAFTLAFAVVLLLFIMVIPNTNVNAAVTAPSSNSSYLKDSNGKTGTTLTVVANSTVTIYGAANGGSGNYRYLYQYAEPGSSSYITLKDYSTSGSVSFTPTSTGTYSIKVSVKSYSGSTASQAVTKNLSLKVIKVSLSSSISSTEITQGESVTIKASLSGGSDSYIYYYSYTKDGATQAITDTSTSYTSSDSISFTPTSSGTYTITVYGEDTDYNVTTSKRTFTLTVNAQTLINNCAVSKTNVDLLSSSTSVTITYDASGGSGNYKYQAYYTVSGSSEKNYICGSSSSFAAKSSGKTSVTLTQETSYYFTFYVKDTSSNITTKKSLSVTASGEDFQINFDFGDTSALTNKNDKITITPATTGSSKSYTWDFSLTYTNEDGEEETFFAGEYDDGGINNRIDGTDNSALYYSYQDTVSFYISNLTYENYIGTVTIHIYAKCGYVIREQEISLDITAASAEEFSRSELTDLVSAVNSWASSINSNYIYYCGILGLSSFEINSNYVGINGLLALCEEVVNTDNKEAAIAQEFLDAYNKACDLIYSDYEEDYSSAYINLLNAWSNLSQAEFITNTENHYLKVWVDTLASWANALVKQLGEWFTDFSSVFDISGFVEDSSAITGVIMIFADSLIALFFTVNFINTMMQYQLFTVRGAVQLFGQLMLAEVWVNLSIRICLMIVDIVQELVASIVSQVTENINSIAITFTPVQSGIAYVGDIVDLFVNLLPLLICTLIFGFIVFTFLRVFLKLVMRSLEITMMTLVSPIFFALLVGDTTKAYFRKFISAFIGVVAELVFMSIVFAIYCYWTSSHVAGLSISTDALYSYTLEDTQTLITYVIVTVACGLMMVKPPAVLRGLING